MENILDRLSKYMLHCGLTNNKVTVQAGLSNGLLGNAFKSGKGLNSDSIEKILHSYRDLNPEWLIIGRGEMLLSNISITENEEYEKFKSLPLLSPDLALTFFSDKINRFELKRCTHYIVPTFNDADFLIQMRDSTMIPNYYSGDLIACKLIPPETFFQWNKVYLLYTEQGILIKRINKGVKDDSLFLVSDNANFPPFELKRSMIHRMALVLGFIRPE